MDISEDNLKISGIHHITAIAASPAENLDFYETFLGLRLVKQTVNFDDPYTYHLYYGDRDGTPGTIITFFPWEDLPRGRAGAGMVTAVALAIPGGSLPFWQERLRRHDISFTKAVRFDTPVLQFEDPHGLTLELVATPASPALKSWPYSSVPSTHAIRGFHSATALIREPDVTQALLTRVMGMTLAGKDGPRLRFRMAATDAPGHFIDLVVDSAAPSGRQSVGTVHHIAFRAADVHEQNAWRRMLLEEGHAPTTVADRHYFKSIYFREPGGILFEIATDPPGFAVDESEDQLGGGLKLPPRYEPMRSQIESRLPALRPEGHLPRYPLAQAVDIPPATRPGDA